MFDFNYAGQDSEVTKLLAKYQDVLNAQYDREQRAQLDQAAFESYFSRLFEDVPGFMRHKLPPAIFNIKETSSSTIYLQVDFTEGRVSQVSQEAAQRGLVFEMPACVINDCVSKRMFNVLAPSKRLRIHLPTNDKAWLQRAARVMSLLSWHDQGYFPLRNNLSARSMAVRLRRWRDIYEYVRVFARYRLLKRPLVTSDLWPVRPQ